MCPVPAWLVRLPFGSQAGQVTGQGVSDFFVATPGLARIGTSAAAPAPAAPSGGYGY
jgi:hypothetical protein